MADNEEMQLIINPLENGLPMNQITYHCYQKVLEYFEGDKDKTDLWFDAHNPNLGGLSANDMILLGKIAKLKSFIDSALEENKRE